MSDPSYRECLRDKFALVLIEVDLTIHGVDVQDSAAVERRCDNYWRIADAMLRARGRCPWVDK